MRNVHETSEIDTLFSQGDLSEFLRERQTAAIDEVEAMEDDSLRNAVVVNATMTAIRKHAITPLKLNEFRLTADTDSKGAQSIIRFTVPFTGDKSLFDYTPRSHYTIAPRGEITDNAVIFAYPIKGNSTAEAIKAGFESDLGLLKKWVEESTNEVNRFNESVRENIKRVIEQRQTSIAANDKLLEDIGYSRTPKPAKNRILSW